ncbi:unnamed protein product [Miscanthus lutarioriparius]|uniref:Uncharacterized protein n=1 Tax=Miscanthus lutarioriparius TaxID=422564 RepID=A0A811NN44_9POAL|nr:unnamed protein product [Miscanthus lutarioriparius]
METTQGHPQQGPSVRARICARPPTVSTTSSSSTRVRVAFVFVSRQEEIVDLQLVEIPSLNSKAQGVAGSGGWRRKTAATITTPSESHLQV